MMKKGLGIWFMLMLAWFPGEVFAQALYFSPPHNPPKLLVGDTLSNAWAGGMNACQFSSIDLNFDAQNDLLIFERTGNRILPFLREQNGNLRYAPELRNQFPQLKNWVLATDFDGDGREDLFSGSDNGIIVWKNTSVPGQLSWDKVTGDSTLFTDYGIGPVSLFTLTRDLPAIADIDGDSDLDILTFVTTTQVEWHRNLSIELYGNRDSLIFELADACWGNFAEATNSSILNLGVSCKTNRPDQTQPLPPRHSGSTLTTLDMNGDGAKELLLGDFQASHLTLLTNGGTPNSANMTAQDNTFPSNSFPVNVESFPGAFLLDADADGDHDLIVAPNLQNGGDNLDCNWLYENQGTDSLPDFAFAKNNFLQETMLDLGEGAAPVIVDYNQDGLEDLVVGTRGEYVSWATYGPVLRFFKNAGSSNAPLFVEDSTVSGNVFSTVLPDGRHPAFADLDGDGKTDLVLGHVDGTLTAFRNVGTGVAPIFDQENSWLSGIDVGAFATPTFADLSGDSLPDLIVGEQNGNLNFYLHTGTTQSPSFQLQTDSLGGVNTSAAGSFANGFSAPDFFLRQGNWHLLVGGEDGKVRHYDQISGNLQGQFHELSVAVSGIDEGIRVVPAAHDWDGDGWEELLIGNYAGGVNWWAGADPQTADQDPMPAELFPRIWPNPGTGHFFVEVSGAGPAKWQVINTYGKVLRTGEAGSGTFELDLRDLSPGIYLLKVSQENQVLRPARIVIRE